MFEGFTTNQKMSVVNLLLAIGYCDGENSNQDKEIECINTFIRILGVRYDSSKSYFDNYGLEKTISDLRLLSKNQKKFLIGCAWDMIVCDGKPNETELEVTKSLFEKIGVSNEVFFGTIKMSLDLMQQLKNNHV